MLKLRIIILLLTIVLICLLIVASVVDDPSTATVPSAADTSGQTIPSETVTQPSSQSSAEPIQTEPSSQAAEPATEVSTEPATQAPTQPATVPDKPYTENKTANVFIEQRMASWICPMRADFGEVVGSRTFASSLGGGKRAHAGLDFVAPHGTEVYAITSGTVQRVALFYQNTVAVEVCNDDGSILRYCEIETKLKEGDSVQQGDVIGTVLRANSGTEMLHMEVYLGDGEGMLTQTGNKAYPYVDASENYQRRSDLLDPTFLKDLPKG